jgi:hypothetical protein
MSPQSWSDRLNGANGGNDFERQNKQGEGQGVFSAEIKYRNDTQTDKSQTMQLWAI